MLKYKIIWYIIDWNVFQEVDYMTVMQRYEALKSRVVNRKEEFTALIDFMENKTEYLTAPSSTRFHLCPPKVWFPRPV